MIKQVTAAKDTAALYLNALQSTLHGRLGGHAQQLRQEAGKSTGSVRFEVDGYLVVADLPKRTEYDQLKLKEAVEALRKWGEDPEHYVAIEIKVAESKYTAWPPGIRQLFEPARTLKTGNAMMHRDNQSRADVQAWLQARFGADVPIGEGAYIDPYDEGGMAAVLRDPAEHMLYRARAFAELRQGRVANFSIARQKIQGFIDSIRNQRPASSVGQKCGMDKADNLAVDLAGNVITCQNVSAKAVAPNGQAHKIGHLSDLPSVKLKTATHWSQRRDCAACPVLQLCQGSCMFLEGPLWEAGCNSAYSDNVPFFAAAIEFLTGYTPYYIEGEFRDDRKDLFGSVRGVPATKQKRVIEIHAVPT